LVLLVLLGQENPGCLEVQLIQVNQPALVDRWDLGIQENLEDRLDQGILSGLADQ